MAVPSLYVTSIGTGDEGRVGKKPTWTVTQRARETATPRTRGSFVLCSLVCGTLRVCTTLE